MTSLDSTTLLILTKERSKSTLMKSVLLVVVVPFTEISLLEIFSTKTTIKSLISREFLKTSMNRSKRVSLKLEDAYRRNMEIKIVSINTSLIMLTKIKTETYQLTSSRISSLTLVRKNFSNRLWVRKILRDSCLLSFLTPKATLKCNK